MSTVIQKYYDKLEQLESLKAEVENLEASDSLKKELEFKGAVEALLDSYSLTAKDAVRVLHNIDPHVSDKSAGRRKPRTVMLYKNPHTGEVVKTKGANHKTLKAWKEEYGADEVDSWKEKA